MPAHTLTQLTVAVAPQALPLTMSDAKRHLGVTDTEHDLDIESLIRAASEYLGRRIGRTWMQTEYLLRIPEWPHCCQYVELPRPPLITVDSVKYYDTEGVQQTYNTYQLWQTADVPARIFPPRNEVFPAVQFGRVDGVEIEYTAGYGDTSDEMPAELKQAIRLLIRHWYDNPAAVALGTISKELELSLSALCNSLGTGVCGDL